MMIDEKTQGAVRANVQTREQSILIQHPPHPVRADYCYGDGPLESSNDTGLGQEPRDLHNEAAR